MAKVDGGQRRVRFGIAERLRDLDRANAWLLTVDNVPQSYVDLEDSTHLAFDCCRRAGDVIDFLPAAPLEAIHVGGGACTVPRYIAATRPGSKQLVVDIDDELVAFVREWLDPYRVPDMELRVADGRDVIAKAREASVDLVVLDAFEAGNVAGGLDSAEFTREVARVLRAPKTYIINTSDGPDRIFSKRLVATVAEVFGNVLSFVDGGVLSGERSGNIVIVASDVPLPLAELVRRAASARFPVRLLVGAASREFPCESTSDGRRQNCEN